MAVRHLGFYKFGIFTVDMIEMAKILPNLVKNGTIAELWPFNDFFKMAVIPRPPSWIFKDCNL